MAQDRISVLVVDDERFFREAIQDVLHADGFETRVAGTAAEALELALGPDVGVVVLDIQLRETNGLEVLRKLRETSPEKRVVVLSAHTDQDYVLEALRLGACDYLAKPIHEEELRLSVRRALETYRVAVQSESLRRRMQRLAHETRTLVEEAQRRDPDALAAQVVDAAGRLLDAQRTSLLLLDPSGGDLRVTAACGAKLPVEQLDPVPLGAPVAGWVATRGEPLVVADARRDARLAGRAVSGRYASASFVVVPVGAGHGRVGALCATDRSDGAPFGESDAVLLGVLADVLTARLAAPQPPEAPAGPGFDDEPAEAADGDAELARSVCEAVTSEVEPGELLTAALRAVAQRLRAAPVAVYLADGQQGPLVREAQWEGAGASDRARLPRDGGLTGTVFQTGLPVASPRPQDDPRFAPEIDTAEQRDAGPLLVVPLRFRGRTLGVCRAFPAAAADVSPRTAEVLGAALSAAVRNVLLYRSLLQSIDEVARSRREARDSSG
jgi:DNA-binding NarL/FixJ family response regulator